MSTRKEGLTLKFAKDTPNSSLSCKKYENKWEIAWKDIS